MSTCAKTGISFLYRFDLGNKHIYDASEYVVSATSQAEGDFDRTNVLTDSVRQVWRSADVLTWQEIIIRAEEVSNIDTFAILGHNFSDSAVVQLQANISNNFLAPPVTITIPWREQNMVWLEELGSEYEYYKLRVLDPANPCGYLEIGRIVGGRALTLTGNEDISDNINIATQDYSEQMKTEGFFRHSNQRVKARTLSASTAKLDTKVGNNTNFQALRTMFRYVGISVPLLVVADRQDPELFTAWGQFDSIPSENWQTNGFATFNMKFSEMF